MLSCTTACPDCDHSHIIGRHADVVLMNNLIIAGGANNTDESIIQTTVEIDAAPQAPRISYYSQVHSKAVGTCTIRVTRMGDLGLCADPAETIFVHYLIINPT